MQQRGHRFRQVLAWSAHLYTGLGLVVAAFMAVLIVQGDPPSLHRAFALMLVATVIDATDGTLARAVHVKDVLPGFDGRRLDDIIDFLTYTALPLLLLWRAQLLPAGQEGWLVVPLLASAYGFCQVSAKTEDGYFLGFPSYWNLVAFYLYLLHCHVAPLPGWVSLGLLLGFALLTFVPTRYLYTSQRGPLNRLTNWLAVPWTILLLAILTCLLTTEPAQALEWPGGSDLLAGLIVASLYFPIYYLLASWTLSWLLWREERLDRNLLKQQGSLVEDAR